MLITLAVGLFMTPTDYPEQPNRRAVMSYIRPIVTVEVLVRGKLLYDPSTNLRIIVFPGAKRD